MANKTDWDSCIVGVAYKGRVLCNDCAKGVTLHEGQYCFRVRDIGSDAPYCSECKEPIVIPPEWVIERALESIGIELKITRNKRPRKGRLKKKRG